MDITIDTIISAIEHCSNKQESEMIRQFKAGHGSWAGIVIEEMLSDYLDSLVDMNEPTKAQEQAEWNRDQPRG